MDDVYSEIQKSQISVEFKWIKDHCYLDYAAAALHSSRQVKASADDLCSNLYGNPHSLSEISRRTNDAVDLVRYRILQLFHTNSREYSVIFTSGATGAIKLLVESFQWIPTEESHSGNNGEWYDAVEEQGNYVYMASNHTSVVGAREIAAEKGANVLCISDSKTETFLKTPAPSQPSHHKSNSLFAYSAQCNFSGRKCPLEWIENVKSGSLSNLDEISSRNTKWFTLLDAASYCSTSDLDLSKVFPDFICLSFYKIFGYPTGLGALLVRNGSSGALKKIYFGGGTVDMALTTERFHSPRRSLQDRFEDGTLPYLSILSLGHGLDTLQRLGLNMHIISKHVFNLAQRTVWRMKQLRHFNGKPLVQVYAHSDFSDMKTQGGIVTFNLKKSDDSFIGYVEVLHIANLYKIQLRTGCFCNIGACQSFLGLSNKDLKANFQAGHVCGDERDMVDGRPTGAIRVSFGYPSLSKDVDRLLQMLGESFLERKPTLVPTETKQLAMKPMLTTIRLYPIKSCGAMEVKSWSLTARGLHLDRQWMVVTSNGVCLTQKEEPNLCRVLPIVEPITENLQLTFSGSDLIVIKKEQSQEEPYKICANKVCGDRVDGEDCGDDAAAWLSYHLGRDGLRLVRQRKDDGRRSKIQGLRQRNEESAGQISLANQAQYLLLNLRSVNWLKQRIPDEPNFNPNTLTDRFRANLIIDGTQPFDELKWSAIRIGSVVFKVEGPCTRCQMICIDQQTGEKNRKPLVELSRALEGKLRFGIYCSHVDIKDCKISIGDTLVIEHGND